MRTSVDSRKRRDGTVRARDGAPLRAVSWKAREFSGAALSLGNGVCERALHQPMPRVAGRSGAPWIGVFFSSVGAAYSMWISRLPSGAVGMSSLGPPQPGYT